MCKKRILYIEDDPSILSSVQTLLETTLPVAVDTCTSGAGAELMLNRYCYDLVITDIGLPIIDGIQILERVLQRDPGQPVMLLSEYDSSETIQVQADRIGVPITPKFSRTSVAEFVSLVEKLLDKRPCPENANLTNTSAQAIRPLTLSTPNESKARTALQIMGCSIAGACKLHKECLERARNFAVPVLGVKTASATPAV